MYSGLSTQKCTESILGNNILAVNSTITSTSRFSNIKSFSFGSHQSFPLRYGWIEKFCLGIQTKYGNNPFEKEELRPEVLSQNYGLGNNMAKSLRFWLKFCGIINDNPNSNYTITQWKNAQLCHLLFIEEFNKNEEIIYILL